MTLVAVVDVKRLRCAVSRRRGWMLLAVLAGAGGLLSALGTLLADLPWLSGSLAVLGTIVATVAGTIAVRSNGDGPGVSGRWEVSTAGMSDPCGGDHVRGNKFMGDHVERDKYEIHRHFPLPVVPERVSVGAVPLLADCFQSRPEHQQALGGPGTVVLSQVYTGGGGVGKTQLAAALAHRLWDDNAVRVRVWISATSIESIVDGYVSAAAEVGQAGADAIDSAHRFMRWLTVTERPWLVVLDDVTEPVRVREWVPHSTYGRVVVTTRRTDNAMASIGTIVPVGLFTPDQAHAYLRAKLARYPGAVDEVEGLAADLGYLPLALAQAAAFIADDGRTCSEYRQLLADRQWALAQLVPKLGQLPDGHQRTVDATWSLSIEAVDREIAVGLARKLLTLSSLLDPEGIPATVLASQPALAWLSPTVTAEEVRRVCRILHRYSLAVHNPATPARALRVHALGGWC